MTEPVKATAADALKLMRAISARTQEFKQLVESLWELGQMGPTAVPPLLDAVADQSESPFTRTWALYLVEENGGLGLKGTREVLLANLADPNPAVRRASLRGLGHLGDASLVPLIAPYLDDHGVDVDSWWEDDCTVAHAAAAALRSIGTTEALQSLEGHGGAGA